MSTDIKAQIFVYLSQCAMTSYELAEIIYGSDSYPIKWFRLVSILDRMIATGILQRINGRDAITYRAVAK